MSQPFRSGPSTGLALLLIVAVPLIVGWVVAARTRAACEASDAADCDLTVLLGLLWAGAALAAVAVVLDL